MRIHRADAPCSVVLNGVVLGYASGDSTDLLYDVKQHLNIGKNTLTLEFSREDVSDFCGISCRMSRISVAKCELVCFNDDIITSVRTRQQMCDGYVKLSVMVDTLENKDATRAVATIVSPGGRIFYCGISGGVGSIDITEPNLWWPSEFGVQNLYKLSVNLYAENEIVDSLDMKLGLVEMKTRGCERPEDFSVIVNGVELFSRGVCYVPDDMLLPMLSESRARALLTDCKRVGFNTVVLPDLGVYAEDFFYKICDELGLVIWQELRADKDIEVKRREIQENIRSRSYHASLGVILLTDNTLDDAVKELLPDCATVHIPSLDKICEHSYPSVPSYKTVSSVASSEEANIFSETMQLHSTLRDNCELLDSGSFRYPNGIDEINMATCLRESLSVSSLIDKIRRENSRGYVILPRLNDPWPCISESSVDYLGRWGAQHYAYRHLFAPVMVSAVNDGTHVTFFVSNKNKQSYSGTFRYSVRDNLGECLFKDKFDVTVPEGESIDILTVDLGEVVSSRIDECFLEYSVADSFIVTSKGILLFTNPKMFRFKKPTFETELSGSGTNFVLSVSSDVFAMGVSFSFPSVEARFDDNFISITDSSPVRIEFTTDRVYAIEILRRELSVSSIYDIGRE